MSRDCKRVAIVGAGASGLSAIKCCLDEGLVPVCMERTEDIGGLWNYSQNVREGQACVMKSTTINTSKEMMSFSDFPPPQEFPIYMHNTKVLEYFRLVLESQVVLQLVIGIILLKYDWFKSNCCVIVCQREKQQASTFQYLQTNDMFSNVVQKTTTTVH